MESDRTVTPNIKYGIAQRGPQVRSPVGRPSSIVVRASHTLGLIRGCPVNYSGPSPPPLITAGGHDVTRPSRSHLPRCPATSSWSHMRTIGHRLASEDYAASCDIYERHQAIAVVVSCATVRFWYVMGAKSGISASEKRLFYGIIVDLDFVCVLVLIMCFIFNVKRRYILIELII